MKPSAFNAKAVNGSENIIGIARHICDDECELVASSGEILDACRSYLLIVANAELSRDVAAKVSPSDIVQETLMEAHQAFDRFHGQTREEMLAWLRQILRNNLLNAARRYRQTASRQVALEVRLGGRVQPSRESRWSIPNRDRGRRRFNRKRNSDYSKPLRSYFRPNYREVVELRNRERLTFADVGQRIGRSAEAARKLWRGQLRC